MLDDTPRIQVTVNLVLIRVLSLLEVERGPWERGWVMARSYCKE